MDAFEDRLVRSVLDAYPALYYPGPDASQGTPSNASWDPMARRPSSSAFSALDMDFDSSSSSSSFGFSPPPGSPASSFEDETALWASALKHDAFLVDPPPLSLQHTNGRDGLRYRHTRGTSGDSRSNTRGIDADQISDAIGQALASHSASIASTAYPTDTDASWLASPNHLSSDGSSVLIGRPDPRFHEESMPESKEPEGYPWLARSSLQRLQQRGHAAYPSGVAQTPEAVPPRWRPFQSASGFDGPSLDGDQHERDSGSASPSSLPPFPPLSRLPAPGVAASLPSNMPRLPIMPPSTSDLSRRRTVTARYTRGMMTAQDAVRSYPGEWGDAFR